MLSFYVLKASLIKANCKIIYSLISFEHKNPGNDAFSYVQKKIRENFITINRVDVDVSEGNQ